MKPKRTKGQSIVEFALILPILLIILVMLVDMARLVSARVALSNAAREGARHAALFPNDLNTIRSRVLLEYNNSGRAVTGVELTADQITVSFPHGTDEPGHPVQVTIRCRFPLFFGSWFPLGMVDADGTMLVQSTAEMIIL